MLLCHPDVGKRRGKGLLLGKTTCTSRPLELAFDMALGHVERHMA